MVMEVAPVMHAARLFGTKSPEQAMAVMIKGFELGFSLTAAFENIHVIQDKTSLSPKGALAMIYASSEFAGIKITDEVDSKNAPSACTVWMKRRNGFEYTTRFSMDDAKRAGLVKADSGWEKYPANMLRWRALGYCQDIVFPDVIGGTKRADEFGADLTPDGDVIEGSWTTPNTSGGITLTNEQLEKMQSSKTVSQQQQTTLPELLEAFGAEKVLAANGGAIPGTNEEVAKVEAALLQELEITGGK